MITINAHTKIAAILKAHPDALEAIISITPKFNKLRNPLLRKLMASRTTIGMACKIGGCSVNDFFDKLQALGFVVDKSVDEEETPATPTPAFVKNLTAENTIELDVRAMLEEGNDPFNLIREKIGQLKPQQALKLINTFEPIPLIQILGKQGFETWSDIVNENLVFTYFFKTTEAAKSPEAPNAATQGDWDALICQYEGKMKNIEVRHLEMPLPMLTILDELDNLPEATALYVYHKRIPVFLLPELRERGFEYRIKEISDGEVHLLIFRP